MRRRRREGCTCRTVGAGVWQGAAAAMGRGASGSAGVQGKKAVSGRCFVHAAAAGMGRSAMYGGGSCQMSARRRWDERVGCEGGHYLLYTFHKFI